MARFTDVMTADGGDAGVFKPGDVTPTSGLMSSLGALNVLAGVKAAETVTPTAPTPASSDTKLSAQAKSVPQTAVPVNAQGTVNTNTIEGINAASATKPTVPQAAVPAASVNTNTIEGINAASNNQTTAQPFTTGNTPAAISEANAKVIAAGGSSTDRANRLPGETAAEANARITQAYKDQPKPELTKEGAAAGATIQFVRTGAGGVGKWMEVYPIGAAIPDTRSTTYGNTYDSKGNLISGTGLKTGVPGSSVSQGPGKQPGAAWILSPDGKSWIKPKQPNPTDTWDNEKGWVPAGKTSVGLGKQPGKAWVLSADGKSWVKPTMPTDGKTYTWNDETGWTVGTTPPPGGDADYKEVNGVLMYKGAPHNGMYNGKEYVNGKVKTGGVIKNPGYFTDPTTGLLYKDDVLVEGDYNGYKYKGGFVVGTAGSKVGGMYGGSGTADDPFTENGLPFTGTMFGSTYKNGVIVNTAGLTADSITKQARLDARTEFGNTLKGLGLPQDLVDAIDELIKQDFTKSQMYLELIKLKPYKDRFPGMDALRAAGKAVSEGEYISMEKGFLQTLQYYGIDKNIFGTTAELGKYIGGLTSPKEFEDRVALAAQDVEQNPDVLAELNLYYGVDKSAAITYLLNPTIGLDIIKRQARAAEIGAMAAKSKFDFGQTKQGYGVAESFINAAGTMDLQSLSTTFQQARQLAGNQTRLAQLEGASYNDLEAVSAILGKDQAAILDSQRRAAREGARFGGASGLSSGSLKKETTI